METFEVIAISESKRIRASINVPYKWLSAGPAAIDSFCRGWLKADRKTNGISILATKMLKQTVEIEAVPELPKTAIEQSVSFVSKEQSSKVEPDTISIVPLGQNSNETLSLF